MPARTKGWGITALREGRYLVCGQNPNGTKYFGVAQVTESNGKYDMNWSIGGQEMRGYGEASHADDGHVTITIPGKFDVTFSSQSGFGIYGGTWGSGGTEQLIPASPICNTASQPR
jgi:hypothetical protein